MRLVGPVWRTDSTRAIQRVAAARADAARIAGAALVAILGQLTVDMPAGYFGPADRVTPIGLAYALAAGSLAAAAIVARLRGRPGFRLLGALVASAGIGAFLAPLATDPILAGGIVAWNVAVLGRVLFPFVERGAVHPPTLERDAVLVRNGPAARHLLLVSILAVTAVVGFRVGGDLPAQILCLCWSALALAAAVPLLVRAHGARAIVAGAVALAALAITAAAAGLAAAVGLLGLLQLAAWAILVADADLARDLIRHFHGHPAQLVLVSFVLLIGVGTLVLSFPASAGTAPVAPIDALFTATSAVCVTGLVVLDTPSAFSGFGHAMILALIQIGGLNIMVLSAFTASLLGRDLGLRSDRALGEMLEVDPERSALPLALFIVRVTLAIEALGAAVLAAAFVGHGFEPARAAWLATFHAVSAFCNAGFALWSDSLVPFQTDPWIAGTVMVLITLGGLGFGVLAAAWRSWRGGERARATVQVRVVLVASAFLVAAGALGYGIAEWERTLAGLSPLAKVGNALFQSVTLRTAGFNSVGFVGLAPQTVLLMIAFMFIGASPGGTGGGIKTTTAVVLFGAVATTARRERRLLVGGHTIPLETIYRAAALTVLSALFVTLVTGFLLATHPFPFEVALFEATSAFGTVGLSLGATPELEHGGKIAIALLMLAGRVGPLSLALLLDRRARGRLRYPAARLMVG